jgi:hypothetical protein
MSFVFRHLAVDAQLPLDPDELTGRTFVLGNPTPVPASDK